jgi:hypothetical protein
MMTRSDGTIRFTVLPRRAILAFGTDREKYPLQPEAATIQLPGGGLSAVDFQAFAEINPQAGDKSVNVEIALSAGRTVKGKLVGPDDQPIDGALVKGLGDDWSGVSPRSLNTAEFTAIGLKPGQPRLVCFTHEGKKLAGSAVIDGDVKGPITVKLTPWGTVTGRLIDTEGMPIKNAALEFTEIPLPKTGQPRSLDTGLYVFRRSKPDPTKRTDDEGRFRIEGLIPKLKYNLAQYEFGFPMGRFIGLAVADIVVEPGESRDLGDVTLRPFPKSNDKQGN